MFLAASGHEALSREAAGAVRAYESKDGGARGHKPYAEGLIYEQADINRFYFPELNSKWEDFELVWPEGSFGAAVSYLKTNQPEKARQTLSDLLPLQDKEGGFLYADQRPAVPVFPEPVGRFNRVDGDRGPGHGRRQGQNPVLGKIEKS